MTSTSQAVSKALAITCLESFHCLAIWAVIFPKGTWLSKRVLSSRHKFFQQEVTPLALLLSQHLTGVVQVFISGQTT